MARRLAVKELYGLYPRTIKRLGSATPPGSALILGARTRTYSPTQRQHFTLLGWVNQGGAANVLFGRPDPPPNKKP